jgi:hypothetical protein
MESQFSWTKQWYPISPLTYLNATSPNPDDRWHRHTKFCPNCRRSVLFLDNMRTVFQKSPGLFLLLTLALLIIGIPVKVALITTILAIISLLTSYFVDNFQQRFFSSIPKRGLPIVTVYAEHPSKLPS